MPVQRCKRCGTARRGDLQVCVRCETPFDDATDPDLDIQRPAAPSKLQTHGTMAAVVVIGVALMGVFFGLSVRNVGPFKATITAQQPRGDNVTVTVNVANKGERAGRGNCRVRVRKANGVVVAVEPFVTERIPGKKAVTRTVDVPVSSGVPAEVTCN
jgi:hypothetical protein